MHFTLLTTLLFALVYTHAQHPSPVRWEVRASHFRDADYNITFTAYLDPGWHIYSQYLTTEIGPQPTCFSFVPSPNYQRLGPVKELSPPVSYFDSLYESTITWFNSPAVFVQRIRVHNVPAPLSADVTFMCCSGEKCLPPESFSFHIPDITR